MIALDAIDRRIVEILSRDGRIPVMELAARVGLSATPCGRRIKRLEEAGVIRGYAALVDPAALGRTVSVLISVRLTRHGPESADEFLSVVTARPEVTECLLVTGDADYILRVMVSDIDALGGFIRDVLQAIPSVAETSTMVILQNHPGGMGAA